VGDAENDHALLNACGVSVAVNNSIATLKEEADIITASANGQGVRELISRLLEDDLRTVPDGHGRFRIRDEPKAPAETSGKAGAGRNNMIKKVKGGYKVLSENGKKNLGGPYKSRAEAEKRLRQVEFFKHRKG
jgi:hypothetical protein